MWGFTRMSEHNKKNNNADSCIFLVLQFLLSVLIETLSFCFPFHCLLKITLCLTPEWPDVCPYHRKRISSCNTYYSLRWGTHYASGHGPVGLKQPNQTLFCFVLIKSINPAVTGPTLTLTSQSSVSHQAAFHYIVISSFCHALFASFADAGITLTSLLDNLSLPVSISEWHVMARPPCFLFWCTL